MVVVAMLCYEVFFFFRKYKPGLNSREECAELNDLLF